MSPNIHALAPTALIGLISTSVALVWFYTLWQQFVVDQTRQRLFELRDQWFDVCADAGILQAPAARFIREVLNGQIRFAHRFTVPSVIWYLTIARNRKLEAAIANARASALAALPENLRGQASSILQSASWHVMAGMGRRSLLTILVLIAVGVLFVALAPAAAVQSRARRSIERAIDSELALTVGDDPVMSKLVASTC
jgi:hypothetical protein